MRKKKSAPAPESVALPMIPEDQGLYMTLNLERSSGYCLPSSLPATVTIFEGLLSGGGNCGSMSVPATIGILEEQPSWFSIALTDAGDRDPQGNPGTSEGTQADTPDIRSP
jgi:hypothetical protein